MDKSAQLQVETPPWRGRTFCFLFTVFFPAGGLLAFEAFLSGDNFLGNAIFPTPWHWASCLAGIVGAIILGHVLREERVLRFDRPRELQFAAVGAGVAIATGLYYSLALIPLLPMIVLCIAAAGLGIMGLAPYWYLLGSWLLFVRVRHLWREMGLPLVDFKKRALLGFLLGGAWMVSLDLQAVITHSCVERLREGNASDHAATLAVLRRVASVDAFLPRCYFPCGPGLWSSWSNPSWGRRGWVNFEDERKVFYRIFGRPFNAYPRPSSQRLGLGRSDLNEMVMDWSAARDVGGEQVSGRVSALSLKTSRLSGSVDARAGLGQLDWIMEFANNSTTAREARMRIQLPPGAAASALSLWIGGKECRAAFGGRAQTREAYQAVAVVQRRDPALLSAAGAGQVLLQVFPVPPKSTVQVRTGYTCPLFLEAAQGKLRLPAITERNFDVPPQLPHDVRLEISNGQGKEIGPRWHTALKAGGPLTITGQLTDRELTTPQAATVSLGVPVPLTPSTSADRDGAVRQDLRPSPARSSPERFVLIVDGSSTVGSAVEDWGNALKGWPEGVPVTVFHAGDRVTAWSGATGPELVSWLSGRNYLGGIDPVPALLAAVEEARRNSASCLIWIHGLQSERFASTERLERMLREPAAPHLYPIAAVEGLNLVLNGLERLPRLHAAPRLGDLQGDLARLSRVLGRETAPAAFGEEDYPLSTPFSPWTRVLTHAPSAAVFAKLHHTSDHLCRLWALAAVSHHLDRRDEARATAMAVDYRLITPLSGAVVLEQVKDYSAFGLDPDKKEATRSGAVPEPAEWILMLVALSALAIRSRQTAACQPQPRS